MMVDYETIEKSNVKVTIFDLRKKRLAIITATNRQKPSDWLTCHHEWINQLINQYGAVLLRDFDCYSTSEFSRCAEIIVPNLQEYMFRSTPRTTIGQKIYTSTIYPANREIALHNEFSYFHTWPSRILFYCSVPSMTGGETPIADCSNIYSRLPLEIINQFEKKQVMYVRNYIEGLDISWQEVFQTTNKTAVSNYCNEHHIHYEWYNQGKSLKTWHRAQATISHPISHKKVWFNQAHLFHMSNLDTSSQQLLLKSYGKEQLPRNSFYADGTDIEEDYLAIIRQTYQDEKIKFLWQRGDIMIVDNILVAHGRSTYTGERRIAVAMG